MIDNDARRRIRVYDSPDAEGFTRCTPSYLDRALERGEVVQHEDGRYVLGDLPATTASDEEIRALKRKAALAEKRDKAERSRRKVKR